jgi:hypothetical protein
MTARLPGCKHIVDVAIDVIVELIKKGKNEEEACKRVHFC